MTRVLSNPRYESVGSARTALLSAVTDFIDANGGGEGHFETPVPGIHILRSFEDIPPARRIYRPSLCVVLQGSKQILFGDTALEYGEMECLVVSLDLPASGRMIGATPENPFVGLTVDFDIAIMREILQQLGTSPADRTEAGPCVFIGRVDEPLADCILRLVRLVQTPAAVPFLYPSVMREICYWLLSGPFGGEMAKLALPGSHKERVVNAIHLLRDRFNKTLRVADLAQAARMSASSFHQHFKAMTSMTPLQYQKQMRLLEARRLMVAETANVSEAAYQVGYESASQFSRDYSREFGIPPKQDMLNFKALLEFGSRNSN